MTNDPSHRTQHEHVFLRLDECKSENMQFDPDEFRKLNDEHGPITLDTYTVEREKLCLKFCSAHSSFIDHPVAGETVFMCPSD